MLGRAKQPGVPRPEMFMGREPGTLLADGTAGAMFKLLHAPVCAQDDARMTDIVFIDVGSNMNFRQESWAWWGHTRGDMSSDLY